MREIKFRVYGTINAYYLTDDGWKPKTMMCEVSSLNIKTNKCRVLYKGENNTNEYDTFNLSECNLMQFTGLKDKNGVDIYEGDIVYIAGRGNTLMEFPFFDIYERIYSGDSSDIENILGNIYENPELCT